jgi:hypothetical protein
MGWLADWLQELEPPKPAAVPRASHETPPAIARPRQPKPEVKSVWVQTCAPLRPGDPGAVEAAFYFVAGGVLTMCDHDGKPTGKTRRLEDGDDERRIAGRLKLEAWRGSTSDFNRPLSYPRAGIA